MSNLEESYLTFFREGLFCDLELAIGNKSYNLHQLIVGNSSNLLAREVEKLKQCNGLAVPEESKVNGDASESIGSSQIVLKAERCGGIPWRGKIRCELNEDLYSTYWPDIIEYMYTGRLKQLSTDNIVGWFSLATELELTSLRSELINWIISNITKDDLFTLLPTVIAEPRANQLLRYAISLIAKNFSDFVEADRYTRSIKNSSASAPEESASIPISKSSSTESTSSASHSSMSTRNNAPVEVKYLNFDWRVFPFYAMRDLLHDKNLFAASEEDVFEAIMHYLEKYEANGIDAKEVASLFESVRFERLEYSTLEAALAHPFVPKELLSRALMARLAGFEKPAINLTSSSATSSPGASVPVSSSSLGAISSNKAPNALPGQLMVTTVGTPPRSPPTSREHSNPALPASSTPPILFGNASSSASLAWPSNVTNSTLTSGAARDRRRQSYGRLFQWSSDFDKKGVLYYLGTHEYRTEWQNPFLAKLVDVTWSSIEKGRSAAIFEREPSECWTQDVPSSWFTVDLGAGRSLRITAYTLRHGGGTKQDLIRNWTLKGSLDGKEFTTLMRHKDDESLSTPFATMTWTISGVSQAYRYFKIIQTGHNSSKHNFLSIGGVEFYGELIYDMASIQKLPVSTSVSTATTPAP